MRAVLLVTLAAGLGLAQPADPGKPATTNVMGAEYPKIHADLSVTFRTKAPDAKKVQVDLGKPWDMERDGEGVWSVTIPPQVPGFVARDVLRHSKKNAWVIHRALDSMRTGQDATDSLLPELKMPPFADARPTGRSVTRSHAETR